MEKRERRERYRHHQRYRQGASGRSEQSSNNVNSNKDGNDSQDQKEKNRSQLPPKVEEKKVIDHTAIPDPHMFDNLKRETDEIAALTTKTHAKRQVYSNWAKYETLPDDDNERTGADYETLLRGAQIGSHFQLRSERGWDPKSLPAQNAAFTIDLGVLADSLACLPLYEKLDLPIELFSGIQLPHVRKPTKSLEKEGLALYGHLLDMLSAPSSEKQLPSPPAAPTQEVDNSRVGKEESNDFNFGTLPPPAKEPMTSATQMKEKTAALQLDRQQRSTPPRIDTKDVSPPPKCEEEISVEEAENVPFVESTPQPPRSSRRSQPAPKHTIEAAVPTEEIPKISEKDKDMTRKDKHITQKKKEITEKEKEMTRKDKHITQKNKEITEKEKEITEEKEIMEEKEITEKNKEITEKDKEIAEKDKEITEKDKEISEKDVHLQESAGKKKSRGGKNKANKHKSLEVEPKEPLVSKPALSSPNESAPKGEMRNEPLMNVESAWEDTPPKTEPQVDRGNKQVGSLEEKVVHKPEVQLSMNSNTKGNEVPPAKASKHVDVAARKSEERNFVEKVEQVTPRKDDELDELLSLRQPAPSQQVMNFAVPTSAVKASIDEDEISPISKPVIEEKKEDLEDWLDSMLDD